MKKIKEKKENSIQKRASREQFYKKLSHQRKLLKDSPKDLRILEALKGGFNSEFDFELSETDLKALEKHNSYMEENSTQQINTIQSDIRLNAAIARGKE